MKEKLILAGVHGRPSTKLAFSTMESDSSLVHRRKLRKKEYYRIFEDREVLRDKIQGLEKYLYERKEDHVSLEDTIVVRWGTREILPTGDKTIVYNRADGIANATNKKGSRRLFAQAGVRTPKSCTPDNVQERDLPVIARPNQHSKGRNFVTLNTKHAFVQHYNAHQKGWYYSAFVDKDSEFRVHVAHGKVLAIMEKPRPNGGNIAWNRAQNADTPFEYVPWEDADRRGLRNVLATGIKATAALGLDFAGVDVMVKDGNAYVLEANTAPTLNTSPYVAKRWGMYFDYLFRSDKRREHWMDMDKKDYGLSMVWKNFQLLENR